MIALQLLERRRGQKNKLAQGISHYFWLPYHVNIQVQPHNANYTSIFTRSLLVRNAQPAYLSFNLD